MSYYTTAPNRPSSLALQGGPAHLYSWLQAALKRLMAGQASKPPRRDPVSEAAEVRTLAQEVRGTDPRFAADLFAAADRHEAQGL